MTDRDLLHMGAHLHLLDQDLRMTTGFRRTRPDMARRIDAINWTRVREEEEGERGGGRFDLADFAQRTGHRAEDLILSCKFNGRRCSHLNFTLVLTNYGACYTFNGALALRNGDGGGDESATTRMEESMTQPIRRVRKAGKEQGLQLYLHTERWEYVTSADVGVKVLAHDPRDTPFMKELGVAVQPGLRYFMTVDRTETRSLPEPHGTCVAGNGLEHFRHYTVNSCRLECQTRVVRERCGCRYYTMPGNGSICSDESYECVQDVLDEVKASEGDDCLCYQPCHHDLYSLDFSSSQLWPEVISFLVEVKAKVNVSGEDMVLLDIYYNSISYILLEQVESYPWTQVIGDIGGQMGLFLGASLVTLLHLLEYLVDELGARSKRCSSSPSSQSSTTSTAVPVTTMTFTPSNHQKPSRWKWESKQNGTAL